MEKPFARIFRSAGTRVRTWMTTVSYAIYACPRVARLTNKPQNRTTRDGFAGGAPGPTHPDLLRADDCRCLSLAPPLPPPFPFVAAMAFLPNPTAFVVALFLGGLHAGSLAFVSAVSARALGRLATAGEAAALRAFFRVWWPAGRDWMAPLGVAAAAAYAWLAVAASAASAAGWATPSGGAATAGSAAVAVGTTIAWTVVFMGEDIASLRGEGVAADDQVAATARRFCSRHHVRAVLSVGAYAAVLLAFCW